MADKKGHIRRDIEKMGPGEFAITGIIVTVMIAVVISNIMERTKTEIDPQKDVYLFLHGRTDLQEKAVNVLVTYGFLKEKIIKASSEKVGKTGDYMAMLWKPPHPDHIKIQKITEVREAEPDKIFGLWKGVSKKDIDTVSLD